MYMETSAQNSIINQAYGFIVKEECEGLKILLVEELDGEWSIPGGAVEEFDESVKAGLQRELEEELGLEHDDYSSKDMNIQVSFIYDVPGGSRHGKTGVIDMFLVILNEGVKPVAQKDHLKSLAWCTQEETKKKLVFDQHIELIKKSIEYYQKSK